MLSKRDVNPTHTRPLSGRFNIRESGRPFMMLLAFYEPYRQSL